MAHSALDVATSVVVTVLGAASHAGMAVASDMMLHPDNPWRWVTALTAAVGLATFVGLEHRWHKKLDERAATTVEEVRSAIAEVRGTPAESLPPAADARKLAQVQAVLSSTSVPQVRESLGRAPELVEYLARFARQQGPTFERGLVQLGTTVNAEGSIVITGGAVGDVTQVNVQKGTVNIQR